MKISFEQIFYGHDGTSYQILGSTNHTLDSVIVRVCEAIGTPDPTQKIEPFLVNVPMGNRLIMICGQEGKPDNTGRTTLLFHALICPLEEAEKAGLNATSLFEKNIFKKVPLSVPAPFMLTASDQGVQETAKSFPQLNQIVLVSPTVQNSLIPSLLGERINRCKWASFTWEPLQDFDLYVLWDRSQRTAERMIRPLPERRTFEPVRNTPLVPAEEKAVKPESSTETPVPSQEEKDDTVEAPAKMKFTEIVNYGMLLVSLALNICLLFCLNNYQRRQTAVNVPPKIEEAGSIPQTPVEATKENSPGSQEPPQVSPLIKIETSDDLRSYIQSHQVEGGWPNGFPEEVRSTIELFWRGWKSKPGVTYEERKKQIEESWSKIVSLFPPTEANLEEDTKNRYIRDLDKEYTTCIENVKSNLDGSNTVDKVLQYRQIYHRNPQLSTGDRDRLDTYANKRICEFLHTENIQTLIEIATNRQLKNLLQDTQDNFRETLQFIENFQSLKVSVTVESMEIVETEQNNHNVDGSITGIPESVHKCTPCWKSHEFTPFSMDYEITFKPNRSMSQTRDESFDKSQPQKASPFSISFDFIKNQLWFEHQPVPATGKFQFPLTNDKTLEIQFKIDQNIKLDTIIPKVPYAE